jgi:hypothetical protein
MQIPNKINYAPLILQGTSLSLYFTHGRGGILSSESVVSVAAAVCWSRLPMPFTAIKNFILTLNINFCTCFCRFRSWRGQITLIFFLFSRSSEDFLDSNNYLWLLFSTLLLLLCFLHFLMWHWWYTADMIGRIRYIRVLDQTFFFFFSMKM